MVYQSKFLLLLSGILAVSAILFIVMGILVTMFFSQIIDNFIYKVNFQPHISCLTVVCYGTLAWCFTISNDETASIFLCFLMSRSFRFSNYKRVSEREEEMPKRK